MSFIWVLPFSNTVCLFSFLIFWNLLHGENKTGVLNQLRFKDACVLLLGFSKCNDRARGARVILRMVLSQGKKSMITGYNSLIGLSSETILKQIMG
jgi:hypothetical protein